MSFRNSPWNSKPNGYFIVTKDDQSPLGTRVLYCSTKLEEVQKVFSSLKDKEHFWIENSVGQRIEIYD